MTRHRHLFLLLFLFGVPVGAQPPAVGQNGVVNAASRIPPTLPGGAIARGALFTIDGVRLGAMGATTVAILNAGSRLSVDTIAVQPRRIEARMPLRAPLGPISLVVETAGQASKPFPVNVVVSNPGLFSRNKQGWGPGRAYNLDARGGATLNAFDNPAKPGQRIRLFSTGLGGKTAIRAVIGNRPLTDAIVRPGQTSGEEEITLRIPNDTQVGCYVPFYLALQGTGASNVITVAIGSAPGRCESAAIPLLDEERAGFVLLARTKMKTDYSNTDVVDDHAFARFARKDKTPALSPLLLLPPTGTCTAYASSFQADPMLQTSISFALVSELGGIDLDAGPHLVVARDGQSRNIPRFPSQPGWFKGRLSNPRFPHDPGVFLDPGALLISSGGGKDLGPFQLAVQGPAPLEWTDRAEHSVIDRSLPLTVHWHAESSKRVIVIVATNVGQITTAIGTCLCTAEAGAGSITVPPALLANIPASVDIPGIPYDRLFIAALAAKASPIAISGLDGGAAVSLYADGRVVEYR